MSAMNNPPVVLAISGLDPSGGAGIQADIEAIAAQGCHAASVVTTLTVQDTRNAWRVEAVDPVLLVEQAEAVLADLDVRVVKLGLLGNAGIGAAVADLLERHADIPVVLDPVLVAGGGARLAEDPLVPVMLERLVPRALCVTPNRDEALALVPGREDADACACELAGLGAAYVLLKGGHDESTDVVNRLVAANGEVARYRFKRLAGGFHGSGCTLAAALAARLARGEDPETAVQLAQQYVQLTLENAYRIGRGLPIPARFQGL